MCPLHHSSPHHATGLNGQHPIRAAGWSHEGSLSWSLLRGASLHPPAGLRRVAIDWSWQCIAEKHWPFVLQNCCNSVAFHLRHSESPLGLQAKSMGMKCLQPMRSLEVCSIWWEDKLQDKGPVLNHKSNSLHTTPTQTRCVWSWGKHDTMPIPISFNGEFMKWWSSSDIISKARSERHGLLTSGNVTLCFR